MQDENNTDNVIYTPHYLAKLVASASFLKFSSMFCIFAGGIVLARFLGPEEFGYYTWVLAFISLLGIPVRLGLPLMVTRDVARYRVSENWPNIKGIIEYSNLFVFFACLLIVASVFIVIDNNMVSVSGRDTTLLYLGLVILPIMSFSYIRCAALKGLHEVILAEVPELLVRPLLMLILVLCFVLLGGDIDAGIAIKMQTMAVLLSFLFGFYIFRKKFGSYLRHTPSRWSFKDWNRSTLSLGMFSGLKISDVHLMPFVIGLVGVSADVGMFRVVIHIASMVVIFLSVVEMILSPYIARLYQQGDIKEVQSLFYLMLKVVLVTSIPIFCIVFFFGHNIITFTFGQGYSDAHLAVVVMCIAQLINAATGPAAVVLNMTGHENKSTSNLLFTLFIKVSLCFLLVPQFGFFGAVVAEALGLMINKLLMIIYIIRIFKTGLAV
ncbi:oligosaccharide flippase family protein [Onishia taeanensis]